MSKAKIELLADSSQISAATKELDKLTVSGAKAEDQIEDMTGSTKEAETAARKLREETKKQKKETDALAKKNKALERSYKEASRQAAQLEKSTGNSSRKMGQASIQVEQLVSQITAGANPTQAFAFQASDLGIVLGAPLIGSIVGVTAALSGALLPSLLGGKDAVKLLEESIEKLKDTSEKSGSGILELTKEIRELAIVSELAARASIAGSLQDATKAADQAGEAVRDAFSGEFEGLLGFIFGIDEAVGLVKNSVPEFGTLRELFSQLGTEFGFTGKKAREVGREIITLIAETEKAKTPESFTALQEFLAKIAIDAEKANPKLIKFVAGLSSVFQSGRTAAETIVFLNQSLSNLGVELKADSDAAASTKASVDGLTTSLEHQILSLQKGARVAEIYAVIQRLAGTAEAEQLPALIALIHQKYNLQDAATAATEASRLATKATREQTAADLAATKAGARKLALDAATTARELAKYDNLKQSIILQQQRFELDSDQYELQRNLLALGDDGSSAQIAEITQLTERMQKLRSEAELLGPALSETFGDIGNNAVQGFSQGIADSIMQGKSLNETMVSLTGTILNSLISATIEYGVRQAAAALLGSTATVTAEGVKAAAVVGGIGVQTGAAIGAQAVITGASVASSVAIAAAAAPAAAAVSVATAGAAPAAAAPIALSTIGAIIASIVGVGILARAQGGQVRSGVPYMVGERGPEKFTPNSSGGGRITPFNQLMNEAGGQQKASTNVVNIEVQNNANVAVSYMTRDDTIVLMVEEMSNQSSRSRNALQSSSNVQSRGRI
jgi:hypothetical protein